VKIERVRTFLVDPGSHKHWLFVKVETDTGLHGWGECYTQPDRERAIEAHATALGRYLVGRSPFDIKHFTFTAYTDFGGKRGSMDLYCAISGLEQALWDIAGKATGQPVYNLLGGAFRTKLRVYANGWAGDRDPDTVAESARAVVARGFTALKFDPFPGPWRAYIDRQDEDSPWRASARCARRGGPDVEISSRRTAAQPAACDPRRTADGALPARSGSEPVSARDLGGLIEAKRDIALPVVTGEELYTKVEFHEVIARRAADILNPDVCNCGGILELREIAAMAEPAHIAVSPHNYNSTTLGLAATLHAAAAMPPDRQYFVNFGGSRRSRARRFPSAELVALPTAPNSASTSTGRPRAASVPRAPLRDPPPRG
jgi:galactonate dehydratase